METEPLLFNCSIETRYHWPLEVEVKFYEKPKETARWFIIVGEADVYLWPLPLFKNDKWIGWTVERWFYINIEKVQSESALRKIKVKLVENNEIFQDMQDEIDSKKMSVDEVYDDLF